jgi:biopolymer transport protein ExbD
LLAIFSSFKFPPTGDQIEVRSEQGGKSMAAMQGSFDDRPIAEMNTTPLIDVMLVLLIMFIMTIPIATHSLPIDVGTTRGDSELNPIRNRIQIASDGRNLWNDKSVSKAQLASLLQATRRLPVEPELQFEPDGQARYALAAEVTQIIHLSGITKFGFVGNERYGDFGRKSPSATLH